AETNGLSRLALSIGSMGTDDPRTRDRLLPHNAPANPPRCVRVASRTNANRSPPVQTGRIEGDRSNNVQPPIGRGEDGVRWANGISTLTRPRAAKRKPRQ